MVRCFILGVALIGALYGAASAIQLGTPAWRTTPAATSAAGSVHRTQGEACAEACRREHSGCMISTKGSPTCNSRLQQCLQACLAGRKR